MSVTSTHSSRVASMAGGTLVSRLTGLLRVLVLAWVLGFTPLSDSFNLANTVPNMLYDVVLGGVATATFIPVFVERLAIDGERRAWRSISSVITGSIIVLAVASVLAWVGAPWIIDSLTFLQRSSSAHSLALVTQQRAVATTLLRWFVPQIFFYGVIAIATSLLNIRRRFAVATWVPIANNAVAIAVLVWFHLVDPTPNLATLSGTRDLLWLGLGTTAGVIVQFLCLLPSLARSDLWRLSPRLELRDPAVRSVRRIGSWTLLVVLTNQLSLFVVLAYAFGIGGNGPVSAYTYGFSFMLMPYAVVVVSVLAAVTPQLAAFATGQDYGALRERLGFALRQSLVIIVPCTFALVVLSQPLAAILLKHLNARHAWSVGTVIAILAVGLPGFTVFQLCVRGLQAMQRARMVFALYVLENGLTVALCVAFGRHSLSALCAAVSAGYFAGAAAALVALARRRVNIISGVWGLHVRRSLYATTVASAVMALAYAAPSWNHGVALVVRFAGAALAGAATYGAVVTQMRRRERHRHVKGARLGQF